jgi:hypothetical protein
LFRGLERIIRRVSSMLPVTAKPLLMSGSPITKQFHP